MKNKSLLETMMDTTDMTIGKKESTFQEFFGDDHDCHSEFSNGEDGCDHPCHDR